MSLPVCAQRKFDGGKVPWSAIFFNTYLTWFCIPALFQLYKWSPTLVAILRLILCCLVVLARRAIFIIENPHGSLIYRHHRFEYLTNLVAFEAQLRLICVIWTTISRPETYVWSCTPPSPKVYRQAFWLGLLGGQTPKRLLTWSNDNLISALDLGKLCREKRESLTGKKTTRFLAPIPNCIGETSMKLWFQHVPTQIPNHHTTQALDVVPGRYVDRNGRRRFVGNKAALKQSQNLDISWAHASLHPLKMIFDDL